MTGLVISQGGAAIRRLPDVGGSSTGLGASLVCVMPFP